MPPGMLSNFDIMDMLSNSKSFQGVYMRDRIPTNNSTDKSISYIINLDSGSGSGTHWVCLYSDSKLPFSEYFDSFGLQPPQEVITFLEQLNKPIIYNSNPLQQNESDYCGYYCVYYIQNRDQQISPYDTIYSLTQEPSFYNEYKVSRQ